MKKYTNLTLFIIIGMIVGFLACGGGTDSSSDNGGDWQPVSQEGQQAPKDFAAPVPKKAGEYSIKDASGTLLCRLQPGKQSSIFTNTRTLKGAYTKSDKKKYKEGGSIFAEVKMKDYGFKVRQPDGSLLWKVKVYDGELKIADNEEGLNAFKVKLSGENMDKVKIKKGELELAKFDVDQEKGTFTLPDGKTYEMTPMPSLLYYGIMGIEEIQPPYNYIIIAELLSRKS